MLPLDVEKFQHPSAPSDTHKATRRCRPMAVKEGLIGGPDRDRTDDLFMRSLRSRKSAPIVPSFSIYLSLYGDRG